MKFLAHFYHLLTKLQELDAYKKRMVDANLLLIIYVDANNHIKVFFKCLMCIQHRKSEFIENVYYCIRCSIDVCQQQLFKLYENISILRILKHQMRQFKNIKK